MEIGVLWMLLLLWDENNMRFENETRVRFIISHFDVSKCRKYLAPHVNELDSSVTQLNPNLQLVYSKIGTFSLSHGCRTRFHVHTITSNIHGHNTKWPDNMSIQIAECHLIRMPANTDQWHATTCMPMGLPNSYVMHTHTHTSSQSRNKLFVQQSELFELK